VNYEGRTFDRVLLNKILFEARQRIDVPLGRVFDLLPDIGYGLALSLRGYVWGQKLQHEKVTLVVEVPATWWQHLKQACHARRWCPAWVRRRWPVVLQKVEQTHTFETVALLPGFKYDPPHGCGETYVLSTNVQRGNWL